MVFVNYCASPEFEPDTFGDITFFRGKSLIISSLKGPGYNIISKEFGLDICGVGG